MSDLKKSVQKENDISRTKFSVAICVYGKDNADHFRGAVESVLSQTVQPDEIVLVVDGPIPEVIQNMIESIQVECSYLKAIYLKKNVGHGEARRTGIRECTHNLIAIMDADDICVPNRFELQLQSFKNDDCLSIVGGNILEFIDSTDNIVGARVVPEKNEDLKQYLKKRCPFNQMTVMLKKEHVMEAGGYVDWYCNEDYYLWVRMSQKGYIFSNINQTLCYVRAGRDMYQRRGGWQYFKSEARLQKYMYDNEVIGLYRYVVNVSIRFIVQVLMPNKIRGVFFQRFARKKVGEKIGIEEI